MAGNSFCEISLGEIADFRNGKAIAPDNYTPTGKHPVFGSNGQIARSDEVLYQEPVIVIGRVGAYCGCVHYAPRSSWVTDNAIVALPKEGYDIRFLFYLLGSLELRRTAIGSAQPLMTQGGLKIVRTKAPSLSEQKSIAAVLGVLDDKIELNRRMNTTLEAMARALFQSWFVDFDPVRAKMDGRKPTGMDDATAALFPESFNESPFGRIPKGWELKPLAEAFDVKDGATFRKEDRLESGSIVAFGANGPVGFSARANVAEPCIALGKIGSCGSLHRSWKPCWVTNNAFIVRAPRSGSLEFVWQTLCTIDFTQFIGGSANPYMPLKNFGHTPVVLPPASLLDAYQKWAADLADRIVANNDQSRTLAQLRDTLLPKLLSGEIRIPEAESLAA